MAIARNGRNVWFVKHARYPLGNVTQCYGIKKHGALFYTCSCSDLRPGSRRRRSRRLPTAANFASFAGVAIFLGAAHLMADERGSEGYIASGPGRVTEARVG